MNGLTICIIGAGSSYTPELIEGFSLMRESLPVREIRLMDIDTHRLEIMEGFVRRFAAHMNFPVTITATTDRRRAIEGADFINTQIRVGGNAARVKDEKIPLSYGLIGQETTGAGGMMKALRSIPVMLDIARDVERYSPNAWIINYTNPTGLVTEAITRHTKAKIAGLCSGGLFPQQWTARALGVPKESVRYDYVGLNHMNFAYNVTVDGRPITDAEFDLIADRVWSVDHDMIRQLRVLPSPYLQYFFHTTQRVKEMRQAPRTRGEEVQLLEKEVFAGYQDPEGHTKPEALKKRGGGGYSEVALSIMKAVASRSDVWAVVNVPNQGTVRFLPDNAVIEAACIVNSAGIKPVAIGEVPNAVWGLVSAVKNYEQLAVDAAMTGDRRTALLALMAHPLVREYEVAVPLLNDLLEANREYLPQFFR
ncbi:MAG TPA: 6-phospho-beta-glucosidase [Symbiobacteriaceae bacterium]|nr:6-phospho-beta-glucosidase [Symbiobacteriaceae bacterium]